MKIKQLLISIDQFLNVLADGFADETLSARAYRNASVVPRWNRFMRVTDALFFWQPQHCYKAWISEVERKQYPKSYQIKRVDSDERR